MTHSLLYLSQESLEAVVNDENTYNYLVKMFKRQDRNADGLITQEGKFKFVRIVWKEWPLCRV